MVSRLTDEQNFSKKSVPYSILEPGSPGDPLQPSSNSAFDVNYNNSFVIYSAELNQIIEWNRVTMIVGGRYQGGTFHAHDQLTSLGGFSFDNQSTSGNFEGITFYDYLTVEPLDRLWLTGGFAYDEVTYPSNYRDPPISSGEDHRSQLGPKAAL